MSNYVVGLSGRKRSGKDTFALRLIENGFTRVSFADPLRALALAVDPWVRVEPDELGHLYGPGCIPAAPAGDFCRLTTIVKSVGWEKAKEIREVRRLLQVIGTDGVRNNLGDNTWVEVAVRAINEIKGPVVITDVRFPNEAKIVDDLVRIERPGLAASGDLHISETALDDFPFSQVIVNDGSLEDLYAKADVFAMENVVRA